MLSVVVFGLKVVQFDSERGFEMPCSDGYARRDMMDKAEKAKVEKLKRKIDRLNTMLCEACSKVSTPGKTFSPPLTTWWRSHLRKDKARLAREFEAAKLGGKKKLLKWWKRLSDHEKSFFVGEIETGLEMKRTIAGGSADA